MNRKPTKNTRGPNAEEKRYRDWVKEDCHHCAACGVYAPLIFHHCMGSTYRHNKVLIGHWFCIGLCNDCDSVVTRQSRRAFRKFFNLQSILWEKFISNYPRVDKCPDEVRNAIMDSRQ